jgi:hypothetical protein
MRTNHAGSAGQKTEDAELRSTTEVAIVQAADFGKLHDLPRRGQFDGPSVWCILVEREMGTCPMVAGEIAGQDAAEVSLAEDEHVIQAKRASINNICKSA